AEGDPKSEPASAEGEAKSEPESAEGDPKSEPASAEGDPKSEPASAEGEAKSEPESAEGDPKSEAEGDAKTEPASEASAPEVPAAAESVVDPKKEFVGRALARCGVLALPLGVGVVIGWWAGDQGVRWMPTLIGTLSLVWIGALLAIAIGSYLRGRPQGPRRVVLSVVGILVLTGLRLGVAVLDQPTPLSSLDERTFGRVFTQDAAQYRELDRALTRSLGTLRQVEALRDPASTTGVLSADEEAIVLDAWEAYVYAAFSLDRIRRFYEDYSHIDTGRGARDRHVRSYLLTFAAELSVFEHTANLVALIDRNPNVKKFLNVPRPERGLREDSLAFISDELSGLTDVSRVIAGRQYLRWLGATFQAEEAARLNGYGWLWDDVKRQLSAVDRRTGGSISAGVSGDLAPIERKLKHLVFPIQREIAERMGDTKVRRKHEYLITQEQLDALRPQLLPGDVLLGRKNWYLSNVGLPGFWPHAMLYVGSDEELRRAFDSDSSVKAWVVGQGDSKSTFTEYLALRFPAEWAKRRAAERPLTVIEAVSEGVLQHTLKEASGDYLAALRPRLSVVARAQAVEQAFSYVGRPYDFDFDFATDHELVCSELVWRSYRPRSDQKGLDLPTVTVAGRETVPPQEIAKRYVSERVLPADQRMFDFVLFVDAFEKDRKAVMSDEATFRTTATRSKWDFAQR
ncbi:MAG: hypothetical protein JKY65_17460, partial [Planctomycetes bacterium]|nr:hypothetical protein [Planctomycetota bacterium]